MRHSSCPGGVPGLAGASVHTSPLSGGRAGCRERAGRGTKISMHGLSTSVERLLAKSAVWLVSWKPPFACVCSPNSRSPWLPRGDGAYVAFADLCLCLRVPRRIFLDEKVAFAFEAMLAAGGSVAVPGILCTRAFSHESRSAVSLVPWSLLH